MTFRMSLEKPVCRRHACNFWIAGRTIKERSWSRESLAWKERDLGSTLAKPRSWCPGRDFISFRSPANIMCHVSLGCRHKLCGGTNTSPVVVPAGSTRDTMVSVALWCPVPPLGVTDVLDQASRGQINNRCHRGTGGGGDGYELAYINRIIDACCKFNDILPILTPR